jgi:hypothetical protein
LRFYDPQIGRWLQVDPKIIEPGMYNGMGNDPINQIDPDGGGSRPPGFYMNSTGSIIEDVGNDDNLNYLMYGGDKYNFIGDSYYEYSDGVLRTVERGGNGHIVNSPSDELYQNLKLLHRYDDFSSVSVDTRNFVEKFYRDGVGGAVVHGVEGLWDFASDKAWKAQTWINISYLMPNNTSPDALVAKQQLANNILEGIKNIPNWDAQDYGNATGNILTVVAGGEIVQAVKATKVSVGVAEAVEGVAQTTRSGGRLGNIATRTQIADIATELESRGYTITGGGGRTAEEFLKPLGGGRSGGSFLDITATHPNYPTLRINTVDVYRTGLPTIRELNNAARIRTQIAPGEHLLLIPKQ